MSSNRMSKQDFLEIRQYVKKLRKEGSTTASVAGYLTPKAWVGDEDAKGTQVLDLEDDQYAYSQQPDKKTPHTIELKEASYRSFKEDTSGNHVQKINRKILEINQRLREVKQALDHSIKLKQESAVDNSQYWKKTNEAIIKMKLRIGEVNKQVSRLANIKEIAVNSVKDKLIQIFKKAGSAISSQEVEYNQLGVDHYEFDVMIAGEPFAIDYIKGQFIHQGYDEETDLGNINQEQEVVNSLIKILKK